MAGILKIVTFLMAVGILVRIAQVLGIQLDSIVYLRDLIYSGTVKLELVVLVIFLWGSITILTGLTNRINKWSSSLANPLQPQKIELFTKETPAQIVNAANEAMLNIFLVFVRVAVVFLLVIGFSFLSNPDFSPSNLVRRLIRFFNPSIAANSTGTTNQTSPTGGPTPDPSAMPTPIIYSVDTFPFYNTPTPTSPVNDTPTQITTVQVIETLVPATSTPDPLIYMMGTPVEPIYDTSSLGVPANATPAKTPVL